MLTWTFFVVQLSLVKEDRGVSYTIFEMSGCCHCLYRCQHEYLTKSPGYMDHCTYSLVHYQIPVLPKPNGWSWY
ncbi:hypothetical protein V6Z11_A05G086500 [Gossypium hirsutum]